MLHLQIPPGTVGAVAVNSPFGQFRDFHCCLMGGHQSDLCTVEGVKKERGNSVVKVKRGVRLTRLRSIRTPGRKWP
jgi:hypothetical protein